MIKKYNNFINEKINDYRYPYERIFIFIETLDDFLKIVEEFKKLFNININYNQSYISRITNHLALSVNDFYHIMEIKQLDVNANTLFTCFTYNTMPIDELLDKIDYCIDIGNIPRNYYNRKDVLYPNNYYRLNELLILKNPPFNSIYNKSIENSYESLLNKLEGPSEDDFWNYVKDFNASEMLYKSIKNDFVFGVKKAIDKGAEIKNDDIFIALSNYSYNVVKYLKSNFEFHIKKKHINIYIIQLIEDNRLDIIKLFEDVIKEYSKDDDYIFRKSLELNKIDIFKYLLNLGFNIHNSNEFLLRKYCENLDYDRTKLLLELGADVNIFGGYLIEKAAVKLSLKMVQLLIEYGIKFRNYDKLIKVLNERLETYKHRNYDIQVDLSEKIIQIIKLYNNKSI